MDYTAIISYLYSNAIYGTDYRLYYASGSTTPEITYWNTAKLGTQPSIATLQAAWPSVQTEQARVKQRAILQDAFQNVAYTPISYMSTTFPSNDSVMLMLASTIIQGMTPQGLPSGFQWFDTNAGGVAMTQAQVEGLGNLMFAQIYPNFAKLQGLLAQVNAATTVTEVTAVTW